MGLILCAVVVVSVTLMKDHYEYLKQRSVSEISPREKLIFHRYKFSVTNWLVLMLGVSLFLLSYDLAVIGIILFFYVYVLFLTPVLIHQFLN